MARLYHRLLLCALAAVACLSTGGTQHLHRPRVSSGTSLLFRAALTADNSGGTYSGVGASKTCRVPGATTHTALAADAVCRSATYGTRLGPAGGNLLVRSNALDTGANWVKTAGITITANAVVGPSGNLDAERIQFGAAPQTLYQDVVAGGTLGAFDQLVHGVWMKNHTPGGGNKTIILGSTTSVGGIYYGGVATITDTWDFYWVIGTAQLSGNVRWSITNSAAIYTGVTPTATDIDVVDAYLGNDITGPRSYDVTGAAVVTHNAETITWPWYRRIRADKGTVELVFTSSFLASWDVTADANFITVPVDGGGTWAISFVRANSTLLFTAGGQTVAVPISWAPDTEHTLRVSWAGGQPIIARWDDDYPGASSGNYVVPTFTAGGVITLGGGIDGFYRGLKIWRSVRLPNSITVASFAPLESTLAMTYPPAAGPYVYTGGASTCLDSGGQSMSDKGDGIACYYDAAGSARGIRVSPAWTNRIYGGVEAAGAGLTPTGWLTSAGPVTIADPIHGTYAVTYTANGASKFIYEPDVDQGTNNYSYYTKHTAGAIAANLLGITYAAGLIGQFNEEAGSHPWVRDERSRTVTLGSAVYMGNAVGFGGQPTGGDYTFDAAQYEYDSAFTKPFCSGVPPVTCTAESVSRAFGAELNPVAYTIRLYVTTMFGAGTSRGNSGINYGNARGSNAYLIANTGFSVQWDNANRTWVFTDGTQTATSQQQTFPPDSTHEIEFVALDGAPLAIRVDGQAWVSSAGNKAAQALGATTYVLTHSAGGAELGGWVRRIDIR